MDKETINHTNTPDNEPRSEKTVHSMGDTAMRESLFSEEANNTLIRLKRGDSTPLTLRKHPPYQIIRGRHQR